MNVDAQALINKLTSNYAQEIAIKDQQLAMAQVQIDQLNAKLAEKEDLKMAKTLSLLILHHRRLKLVIPPLALLVVAMIMATDLTKALQLLLNWAMLAAILNRSVAH
ncbi:hypothetical protein OFA97_06270 [Lactiplantibacillus plantarum]|nr:hypothetical protein OFA97_06270 [Lactiplantibacillus plantarum]